MTVWRTVELSIAVWIVLTLFLTLVCIAIAFKKQAQRKLAQDALAVTDAELPAWRQFQDASLVHQDLFTTTTSVRPVTISAA